MDTNALQNELQRKLKKTPEAVAVVSSSKNVAKPRKFENTVPTSTSPESRDISIISQESSSISRTSSPSKQQQDQSILSNSSSRTNSPAKQQERKTIASTPPRSPPSPIIKDGSKLRRLKLDEAGAIPPDVPKIQFDSILSDEDDSIVDDNKEKKVKSNESVIVEKLGNEERDDDFDDWGEEKQVTILSDIEMKEMLAICTKLRQWILTSCAITLNPNRSFDSELSSGIILCKLFASLTKKDEILNEMKTDYSPAMACLIEWKNLDLFFKSVKEYLPKLRRYECEAGDVHSRKNLPRFLAFVCAFAREMGEILMTEEEDVEPLPVDRATLADQSIDHVTKAIISMNEEIYENSSPVYSWLKGISMEKYFKNFDDNGWDTLERVSLMDEIDIRNMGITKNGHVKFLVKVVQYLATSIQWINSTAVALSDRTFDSSSFSSTQPNAEEEISIQEMKDKIKKLTLMESSLKSQNRPITSLRGLQDSLELSRYFIRLLKDDDSETIVIDFASDGFAWVGLAGNATPIGRIPFDAEHEEKTLRELFEEGVKRALDLIPDNEKMKKRNRKIFILGTSPTAAMYDFLLKQSPAGTFICGPKSTGALSLRAVGLVDGVSLDVDSKGVARVTAIKSLEAIPQGFASGHVFLKEGDEKRDDALCGLVLSCLSECGFPSTSNKRVRGGLVATGTKLLAASSISKRFSSGLFTLQGYARWGAASQVAIHQDFQHRWITDIKSTDISAGDRLFPLLNWKMKQNLLSKACSVNATLEKVVQEENQALILEQLNTQNASTKGFAASLPTIPPRPQLSKSLSSKVETKSDIVPHRPAIPPVKRAQSEVNRKTGSEFDQLNRIFANLKELLPERAFLDAKVFVLREFTKHTGKSNPPTLQEVIKSLPQSIQDQIEENIILLEEEEVDEETLQML